MHPSDRTAPDGNGQATGLRPADATAAWQRLQEGNARFAAGTQRHPQQTPQHRRSLAAGQEPFAAVLGCADSRVPPELVFDCGLGELFTVRSAGTVLDDAVLGSLEYAVLHLEVPLLVILGHAGCGAVQATIQAVRGTGDGHDGHVAALIRAIDPAVRAIPPQHDEAAYLAACVNQQTRRTAEELVDRSATVYETVNAGTLTVAPAVYDLQGGWVERLG